MAEITIRRHQAIFDPSKYRSPIHLLGVGATGSRIFQSLVELGCTKISCYDFDVVEAHNLANQAYVHSHIGLQKVAACEQLYKYKTGATQIPKEMRFYNECVPFEGMPLLEGTVFLLTDSMESRKQIYNAVIKDNYLIDHVIETRMASTHGNVFAFSPSDEAASQTWYNSLIDDGVAELSPCGEPMSVGPTAAIIANLAVWQYITLHTDAAAAMKQVDIYLKPFSANGVDYD